MTNTTSELRPHRTDASAAETDRATTPRRRLPLSGEPPAAARRHATPRDAPASLPTFQRYRPRAGHPDWQALARRAEALAAELLPTLERPQSGLALTRRRARAMGTAARNYAVNQWLARQGREDLRPLYFIWTTLRRCNFGCSYCDDHRGRRYPDLPDDGVLDTKQGFELLRIMRTGSPAVYFAGGEPTLRRDLPQLTRRARDLDYYPIIINTNGSAVDRLLAKASHRTWLGDTDTVIVSLDALDLGLLERMWEYRRPEQVIGNLLLLRELAGPLGFKLMVNVVIQHGLLEHARDVVNLADDLGIWLCPVPMNIGPAIDRRLLDDPDYQRLATLILERKRQGRRITGSLRMNERLLRAAPLRCRNSLKPHIDFDGKLIWPCKASCNVAPVHLDVLQHRSVDALYRHARAAIDPTGFCGPGPEQCGAQCNWAQNYSTDSYAHGLVHPLSLLGELGGFLERT